MSDVTREAWRAMTDAQKLEKLLNDIDGLKAFARLQAEQIRAAEAKIAVLEEQVRHLRSSP